MSDDFVASLHQQMIDDGLAPKDHRVYLLVDLANAVLQGHDLTEGDRAKLRQFPYTLEVLDSMVARRGSLKRISVSPGPTATLETFARSWLAVEWEVSHKHSRPVRVLDPVWGWRTDWDFGGEYSTSRRRFYVRWRRIPAWLMDRMQGAITKLHIARDRLCGVSNPYQEPPAPRRGSGE